MRIEEVIGRRIRKARKLRHADIPSQAALGEKMAEYLGTPWSRQAVSYAEKGQRDFKAAELAALALSLKVPLVWLIEPPEGSTVEIAEGGPAIPSEAVNRFLGMRSGTHDKDALITTLFKIRDEAEDILDAYGMDVRTDEEKRTFDRLIDKLADRGREDADG
jgi:transcriptional regulator with XRE-family HTH domain